MANAERTDESSVASNGELKDAFTRFISAPIEKFRIDLRRKRAAEMRQLLADPTVIDLERFNREVWVIESATKLDGKPIKLDIDSAHSLTADELAERRRALDEGRLELHGNYTWGSAARVFGASQKNKSSNDKTKLIRQALVILNSAELSPAEKADQINEISGFGPNITTGLVMMFHPSEFAIYNTPSKEGAKKLGYRVQNVAAFQESVSDLREKLGAEDFLEVDWFLYNVAHDRIRMEKGENLRKEDVRYWAIALGEGARLWQQCLEENIVAIGWDFLDDLSEYSSREDIEEAMSAHYGGGRKPRNNSLACWEFAHEMKIGDFVFAKRGRSDLLGFGRVTSAYEHDPERAEYKNIRHVEWMTHGS